MVQDTLLPSIRREPSLAINVSVYIKKKTEKKAKSSSKKP